jgi:serine/threonine protein phosphatase PrpC
VTERQSPFIPSEGVLYDALDASAPDSASWKRGYEAYIRTKNEAGENMQAYYDALDASAPDARRWKAAWAVIDRAMHEMQVLAEQEREPAFDLSVGSYEIGKEGRILTEDTLLIDVEEGVFGVFDGMGGNDGNPRKASQVAAEAVRNVLVGPQPANEAELLGLMRQSFLEGRRAVRERGEYGSTVATAIKLCVINEKQVMGVAHAGDTRLFKYSKTDRVFTALTADQSTGYRVHNGFTQSDASDSQRDEYKIYSVEPGDRIMLCSDGITGDYEHQFLSNAEFHRAFMQDSPNQSAEMFYRLSKKSDDKSIIVIDVK